MKMSKLGYVQYSSWCDRYTHININIYIVTWRLIMKCPDGSSELDLSGSWSNKYIIRYIAHTHYQFVYIFEWPYSEIVREKTSKEHVNISSLSLSHLDLKLIITGLDQWSSYISTTSSLRSNSIEYFHLLIL